MVFPENMKKLDTDNSSASLKTLEDYISYMQERIDFSISHLRADYITVGNLGGENGLVISESGITFGPKCKIQWSSISDAPTNLSDFTNDEGFIDSEVATEITENTVTTSYVNALNVSAYNIKANSLLSNSFKIGTSSSNYAMSFDGSTGTITFGSGVTMSWSQISDHATVDTAISTAQSTANSASSAASAAQETADTAQESADTAQETADDVTDIVDDWSYETTTYIDGRQIYTGTVTADAIVANASISSPTISLGRYGSISFGSSSYTLETYSGYPQFYAPSGYGLSITPKLYVEDGIDCGGDISAGGSSLYVNYIGSSSSYPTMVYANNFCVETSTTTSTAYCGFNSYGYLQKYSSSSRKYKENILPLTDEQKSKLKGLYDIEVKRWNYKDGYLGEEDELYGKETIGVIAEDVNEIMTDLAVHKNGEVEDYRDRQLLNGLIVLIQDLNERLKVLENANAV